MLLFAILNNNEEKKFIECVAAKDLEDVTRYCDNKYGEQSQPIGLPVVYDTKGNLVQIEVHDLIKDEYKKK